MKVEAVLKNPVCPEKLFNAIGDALSELQSGVDSMSADFLCGLFMAPRKEQDGAEISPDGGLRPAFSFHRRR